MKLLLLAAMATVGLGCCTSKQTEKNLPCSTVHNGTFYTYHNDGNIKITREGNVQVDKYADGSTIESRVEWLDSCQYKLTYVKGQRPDKHNPTEHNAVILRITTVREQSYTVEGWVEGSKLLKFSMEFSK